MLFIVLLFWAKGGWRGGRLGLQSPVVSLTVKDLPLLSQETSKYSPLIIFLKSILSPKQQ